MYFKSYGSESILSCWFRFVKVKMRVLSHNNSQIISVSVCKLYKAIYITSRNNEWENLFESGGKARCGGRLNLSSIVLFQWEDGETSQVPVLSGRWLNLSIPFKFILIFREMFTKTFFGPQKGINIRNIIWQ